MDYAQGHFTGQNRTSLAGNVPMDTAPISTPIRDGVTNAEQGLSALHEAISRLEKRLETVLRPLPPATNSANAGAPTGPPCSHVMGRLHILNDAMNGAVARIAELEGRIEV